MIHCGMKTKLELINVCALGGGVFEISPSVETDYYIFPIFANINVVFSQK